ncbi:hypothetical protein FRB94_013455 [Tulasnella sp. JGI-2019a]|nr:hypothetical protein FRB93_002304 [Tulasnella sp. JGI-2019a]KAG9008293.1 hypothetical protein FRB94_013455 [Tulasnella sp. JGI-2019a]
MEGCAQGLCIRARVAIRMNATAGYCPRGLYLAPISGAAIDSSRSLDFVWDPTGFTNITTKGIDLSLSYQKRINATAGHVLVGGDISTTATQSLHFIVLLEVTKSFRATTSQSDPRLSLRQPSGRP